MKKDFMKPRKVHKKNVLFCLALGATFGLQVGCGSTQGTPPPAETPQVEERPSIPVSKVGQSPDESVSQAASMLGLRIISEAVNGRDPQSPDSQVDLTRRSDLDDSTAEGNEILLHRKLYLPDVRSPQRDHRRNLFFVWPEDSLGSRLSSAVYSHRIVNANDQVLGNLIPERAWHDTDHHRWFIPLTQIFRNRVGYAERDMGPEDIQELTLELTLENGGMRFVRIRFQAVGPYPEVQVAPNPAPQPAQAADLIRQTSERGWQIYQEQITNPLPREFFLWFRNAPVGAGLSLKSYIRHPFFRERPTAEPEGPFWLNDQSTAQLEVNSLGVRHGNGEEERIRLRPGQWSRVILRPLEVLTLEWWAHPVPNSRECHLFPAQIAFLNWQVPPPPLVRWRSDIPEGIQRHMEEALTGPRLPEARSRQVQIQWEFVGASLSGQWNRDIRLTHPFLAEREAAQQRGEAPSPTDFIRLGDPNPVRTEFLQGQRDAQASDYPCQGIFR